MTTARAHHGFDVRPLPAIGGPSRPAVEDYVRWQKAAARSHGTIYLRLQFLRMLAATFPDRGLLELQAADLAQFLSRDGWGPEARKSARNALRSFYSWATDEEMIRRDPSKRLGSVRIPLAQPRPAPDGVLAEALAAADTRDRLMLMLAAYAGLRVAEIARVHTDDVLGDVLRVNGKGGRVRHVPLHPDLHAALAVLPSGWVFPAGGERSPRYDDHLTATRVGIRISALLPGEQWTAHTLRHRFASRAYSAERDIRAVQVLLGHSKVETTQRYTAIPNGALRAAVNAAVGVQGSA